MNLDAEEKTPSAKLFSSNGSETTLVIDPIDGTTQYIAGTEQYSICVGLLQKGKIITALIYFPNQNHFYFIGADGNAYVSKDDNLNQAKRLMAKSPNAPLKRLKLL